MDKETGEEIRDENGLCIRCGPGEPGEWVGEIVRNHPVRDFHGYADKSATRKKILNNVWKKGDMCFRSGDILVMDQFGWIYFKDRVGDTFRWKGENVSNYHSCNDKLYENGKNATMVKYSPIKSSLQMIKFR